MGAGWITAGLLIALQSPATRVTGVVRDAETGGPVAGALVRLADLGRAVVTDGTGTYTFLAVSPGPHHLEVRRIGYLPRSLHALVPARGTLAIDITMQPLPRRLENIEVRPLPMPSLGGPESTQRAPERTLLATGLQRHPRLAEPDAFLALDGGAITHAPEAPSGVHVLGGSADHTAFVINGIPVLSPYHAAGAFSAWNPDALARVRFSLPASGAGNPDALSGTISADTRAPQPVVTTAGGLTTTHARITIDGPLGPPGGGFLVAVRAGFPGAIAPSREPSYLQGNTSDVIATLEQVALGGRLRLLAYDSQNEFQASAVTSAVDPVPPDVQRNEFQWRSRSVGADWQGSWRGMPTSARAWSATARNVSRWGAADSVVALPLHLVSLRDDVGAVAHAGDEDAATGFVGSLWLRASRTRYAVRQADGRPRLTLGGRTPVAALDLSRGTAALPQAWLRPGVSVYHGAGRLWLAPRLVVRSAVSPAITLAGSLSRGVQFTQSLRNPESVVSVIFPPDLDIGAGVRGVPVARSIDALVSAELRSSAGLALRAVAWSRRLDGLLLTATTAADPFAADTFATGSGSASGAAIELAATGARYAAVASYTWQNVRRSSGDVRYIPGHGARHVVDAGLVYHASPTFSARLATTVETGRRSTSVLGGLEWESCNLLDRGCEFGGSPRNDPAQVGGTSLPPYFRVDAGVRKHWHLRIAGRDGQLALHGTMTNLLSRANVLTRIRSDADVRGLPLEMRPFAPLVVGLDWRF
jgi:hypothetical protein